MSAAHERGARCGRHLKRLERKGIIGAANNPYRKPDTRADWEAGFRATYYAAKESL